MSNLCVCACLFNVTIWFSPWIARSSKLTHSRSRSAQFLEEGHVPLSPPSPLDCEWGLLSCLFLTHFLTDPIRLKNAKIHDRSTCSAQPSISFWLWVRITFLPISNSLSNGSDLFEKFKKHERNTCSPQPSISSWLWVTIVLGEIYEH